MTETARRLRRTQSAVSHSLAALRRHLGDALFVRVSSRLEPTARAKELEPLVRELMAQAERALTPQVFDPQALKRTFKLLLSDYVQVVMMPALLKRLPSGVRLDVHFRSDALTNSLAELAAGAWDLTVAPMVDAPAGVVRQKVFDDRNVCVLRARNRFAKRLTIERFAKLPHIQLSPRGLNEDFVDAALKKHGLTRTIVARVPHFTTAPQLVHAADGIAVVPERLAHAWSARDLTVVEAPVPLPGFSMATYFPETSRHDPAHVWFRRMLSECVRV